MTPIQSPYPLTLEGELRAIGLAESTIAAVLKVGGGCSSSRAATAAGVARIR
jgi:hypothetical protein